MLDACSFAHVTYESTHINGCVQFMSLSVFLAENVVE